MRKIISAGGDKGRIIAVCDDGTVWDYKQRWKSVPNPESFFGEDLTYIGEKWELIPPIPDEVSGE